MLTILMAPIQRLERRLYSMPRKMRNVIYHLLGEIYFAHIADIDVSHYGGPAGTSVASTIYE